MNDNNNMANTVLQNCQRGEIFLLFLIVLIGCFFLLVKLIKRQIDFRHQSLREERYSASPLSRPTSDNSPAGTSTLKADETLQKIEFDRDVIKSTITHEDDTCVERTIKKFY